MAHYTNEQMNKDLREYVALLRKRFSIENVLLFGSRARGDYLYESDVDVIIVSKDFASIPFRKRMGELLEGWQGAVDLEVIGYTPEEFERMKQRIGIVKQAVKEGILI